LKKYIALIFLVLYSLPGYCDQPLKFASIEHLAEQEVAAKILCSIYERLGIQISIEPMPGKRAHIECVSGNYDGETARIYSYGNSNPTLMRVPTPYSNLDTTAFALKSKNISIKSKDDLKKYKIVVIRGVQHTFDITKGMHDISLIDDCESMIKFLESDRADVALTNSLNGISVLNKSNRHNIEIVGHLEKLDLYHYINSKYAQLIAKIDTIIQDMDRSGELTRLRSQFENEYLMNQLEHSKP
jgi:hypothetical protein